ncbi:MAG: hypothetical protein EBU01_04700, partial [Crocinitomicaceae bacterium]|nr:hypothetical protein [Crocinitomicaceae bacterium]
SQMLLIQEYFKEEQDQLLLEHQNQFDDLEMEFVRMNKLSEINVDELIQQRLQLENQMNEIVPNL